MTEKYPVANSLVANVADYLRYVYLKCVIDEHYRKTKEVQLQSFRKVFA